MPRGQVKLYSDRTDYREGLGSDKKRDIGQSDKRRWKKGRVCDDFLAERRAEIGNDPNRITEKKKCLFICEMNQIV